MLKLEAGLFSGLYKLIGESFRISDLLTESLTNLIRNDVKFEYAQKQKSLQIV